MAKKGSSATCRERKQMPWCLAARPAKSAPVSGSQFDRGPGASSNSTRHVRTRRLPANLFFDSAVRALFQTRAGEERAKVPRPSQ